jgi:chemotaxis protein MotB
MNRKSMNSKKEESSRLGDSSHPSNNHSPKMIQGEFGEEPHLSHPEDDFPHAKKGEEGEGPWLISYADMMTLLMGFFALIASFSKPDIKEFEKVKKSAVEKFGGEYKEPYKELEEKIKKGLAAEIAASKLKISHDADGVTIKFDGTTFFDSGNFIVKPEGSTLITKITQSIQKEISTHKAIIEGHTDNVPITDPIIASNWELSAIRAARIAQLMEIQGFQKKQLTIQGWGETRPEVPNTDANGSAIAANQAKNRRVVIKIAQQD